MLIHTNKNLGFTLIELLVVISIIGMLASMILAGLSSARAKSIVGAAQEFDHSTYSGWYSDTTASWEFDDGTGFDSSGNANTLTPSVGAITNEQNPFGTGKTLKIDAGASLSATTPVLSSPPTAEFSVSTWIWFNSVPTDAALISNYALTKDCSWKLDLQDSGVMKFVVYAGAAGRVASGIAPTLKQWYQIVGVYNGASIGIYINGKQVGIFSPVTCSGNNSGLALTMNGSPDGSIKYYLDNVRIYKKALPLAAITGMYLAESKKYADFNPLAQK